MVLVIPLSASDVHLASGLADLLVHFGSYRGHEAVIAPTPGVVVDAEQMRQKLVGVFDKVEVVPMEFQGEGWPLAPNRHFRECAEWIQKNRQGCVWYWFEADNTPLCMGWLDTLDAEYQRKGKRACGCMVPTRLYRTVNGRLEVSTDGQHMVGTGMYPWNLRGLSIMLNTVDVRFPWAEGPMLAFDVHLQHEMQSIGVAHTDLIAHRWRTINYRKEGDGWNCDDQPGNPPGTNHAAPVPHGTVVIHGCRDGSLARLLLADKPAAPLDPKVLTPTPTTPLAAAVMAAIEAPLPPPPAKVPFADYATWLARNQPQPETPAEQTLADKIKAAVKDKGKRADKVARELGVRENEVLAAIAAKDSGLQRTIPGGWIKEVAA